MEYYEERIGNSAERFRCHNLHPAVVIRIGLRDENQESCRDYIVIALSCFVLSCLALLAGPSRGGPQSASATMPIPVEGKIDSSTGQLLILAQFNDTRLWCGLDSGFSALI